MQDIKDEPESLAGKKQDYYDNRSDAWQESDKASEMEEEISAYEDAASSVGDAIDYLEDYV